MVGISRGPPGLSLHRANPPVNNNPPVWDSNPAPVFTFGTSANYDMDDISSDPDSDPITHTMNTGSVSLPSGVTFTPSTGVLAYNGSGAITESSGHINTLDDGTDTTASASFTISIRTAVVMDNWPLVSCAFVIASVNSRLDDQPTKGVVEASNMFVHQGLFFTSSSDRASTKSRLATVRAANADAIIIIHGDFLRVAFDQDSTSKAAKWLEAQIWANPDDYDEYYLRESGGNPFVTHTNGQGGGLAFNWACSNTVMQRVIEGQLAQYTDSGGAENMMPTYELYFMHDTMPEADFNRYKKTVHDGTLTAIQSSTELDIPTWSGVNTTGSPDGSGYTSLTKTTNICAVRANHTDGSVENITGHKVINGSTDRIRIATALDMTDNAGDEFYIFETTGSSGGSTEFGEMTESTRLDGILNFFDRYRTEALSAEGAAVDHCNNGGMVSHTEKIIGEAPTYPSAWIGKWGYVQIERFGAGAAGFFQYDYSTYRTDQVSGASGNIKDQNHAGRDYNPDTMMRAIEYNKLMLITDASSASGYPAVWVNAQTRYFSNYSSLTDLDAAFARFYCCLSWCMTNVIPQIEMDKKHQWPVMIDEQVISAGSPITTRNFGTYDPEGASGNGSFVFDSPTFGTYGYAFEFDNILIVINLRPQTSPGIWIPSWQSGGQSIVTGTDRYTVMSAGGGKKWQRFNRTTYTNNDTASKFNGKKATNYDTSYTLNDTTLNDGSDVGATIDVGALECIVLLRVNS